MMENLSFFYFPPLKTSGKLLIQFATLAALLIPCHFLLPIGEEPETKQNILEIK